MDDKRLDEIRAKSLRFGFECACASVHNSSVPYQYASELNLMMQDLLASHAAQSARIAELEGEVGRLKGVESDFNSYLVESCKTVGADHVVDWDGENPRLALAARYALKQIDYTYTIDALRTRLDAIETAAGEAEDLINAQERRHNNAMCNMQERLDTLAHAARKGVDAYYALHDVLNDFPTDIDDLVEDCQTHSDNIAILVKLLAEKI